MIRLDKYLADLGLGARSQVKQFIRKGQVTVNGRETVDPGQKILAETDEVCFQGRVLSYQVLEYYMLYKPAGCVTARSDGLHRTVMEYLPAGARKDLFPVGRLDLDTEGLLLITNDGALSHRLLSPAHHVEKTYFARVEGPLLPEHQMQFEEGLLIGEEKPTAPARLTILGALEKPETSDRVSGPGSWPENGASEREADQDSSPEVWETLLTITEGRFHQVKRMFQAVGCRVTYLKRIAMGGLTLDESLMPGECRPLTKEELERIL